MEKIKYHSTNLRAEPLTFGKALLKGIAPDKGLYMPEKIPAFTMEEMRNLKDRPYDEIAFSVLNKFLENEIPEEVLRVLVKDAYNFDVPLEHVYDRKYVMRLDQGPTASFKDFAARIMARLMSYYMTKEDRELLVLTATSGDTGSAIANAFYGLERIRVVVLYPEKEVTDRQRKQMTTLEKNIHTISLDGKFDDCQALVKRAFADTDLEKLNLTSANSINIGRLLPQAVYYAYAYSNLADVNRGEEIIFSVPSGNFGNLMGGLFARNMGIPVRKFVVSSNENDEFPVYLNTGEYKLIIPSKNCLSSAMNVGHPSNMSRLVALYGGNMDEGGNIHKNPQMDLIRNHMFSVSIDDDATREMIAEAYRKHKLLLEPHGSVAWAGLMRYLEHNKEDDHADQVCVSLETAHPAKFPEQIQGILSMDPDLPPGLEGIEQKEEFYTRMNKDYSDFKDFLKELF